MSPLFTLLFAAGAAIFYMAASWIMKAWGASPYLVLAPVVIATLAAGAWFETGVRQWSRLGHIVVLVLAIEFLATFFVAVAILGASHTMREFAGAMVVFTGIALLSMPAGSRAE